MPIDPLQVIAVRDAVDQEIEDSRKRVHDMLNALTADTPVPPQPPMGPDPDDERTDLGRAVTRMTHPPEPDGPLSRHELEHVLTELADWARSEDRLLTVDDVREQLKDSGYGPLDEVLTQVLNRFAMDHSVFAAVDSPPSVDPSVEPVRPDWTGYRVRAIGGVEGTVLGDAIDELIVKWDSGPTTREKPSAVRVANRRPDGTPDAPVAVQADGRELVRRVTIDDFAWAETWVDDRGDGEKAVHLKVSNEALGTESTVSIGSETDPSLARNVAFDLLAAASAVNPNWDRVDWICDDINEMDVEDQRRVIAHTVAFLSRMAGISIGECVIGAAIDAQVLIDELEG